MGMLVKEECPYFGLHCPNRVGLVLRSLGVCKLDKNYRYLKSLKYLVHYLNMMGSDDGEPSVFPWSFGLGSFVLIKSFETLDQQIPSFKDFRCVMIELTTLLQLQLLYCILGIGYNMVSYLRSKRGLKQLSKTSPVGGALFMSLYGLLLISGFAGLHGTYLIIMGLCLVVYGYGGVVKHIINYPRHPEDYASRAAWLSAIGVNLFGFLLNLVAVSGQFRITG